MNPFKECVKTCVGIGLVSSMTLISVAAIAEATNKTPLSQRVRAVIHEYATKDHLKEFAKDRGKDQLKDCVADMIMAVGDKFIHGPFTKGGGDEQVTKQVVSEVLDGPRSPEKLLIMVAQIVLAGSELAPPALDEAPQQTMNSASPVPAVASPDPAVSGLRVVPIATPAPNPDRPLVVPAIPVGDAGEPHGFEQPVNSGIASGQSPQHSTDGQRAADSHVSAPNAAPQTANGGWPATNPSDLGPQAHSEHAPVLEAGTGNGLAEDHPDPVIHGEVPDRSQSAIAPTPSAAPATAASPASSPAERAEPLVGRSVVPVAHAHEGAQGGGSGSGGRAGNWAGGDAHGDGPTMVADR